MRCNGETRVLFVFLFVRNEITSGNRLLVCAVDVAEDDRAPSRTSPERINAGVE